ncbi:hypothetical protein [Absidia glauca]|uniref:Uncharacterized protein n=1 Tax=Absidia glauca TaxID=4829 RepID=A0A163KPM1_ABSGL|nr:hypothetical protein [Absidia glauca]
MNADVQQQQQRPHSLLDSYESSENALMDSFKAAALKVTTLYKDSLVQNRKAYASGYQQALQDLYEFISSHPCTTMSQQESFATPMEQGFLPVQDLLTYARQRNDQLASDMGVSSGMDQQQPPSSTSTPPQRSMQHPHPHPHQTTSSTGPDFNADNGRSGHHHPGLPNTQSQSQASHDPMATGLNRPTTNGTATNIRKATSVPGVIGAAVKNAFHPFQIDPNTQFTFAVPTNYHPYGQPWFNNNSSNPMNYHQHPAASSFGNEGERMNDIRNDSNNSHHHHPLSSELDMDGMPMEGLKRRITPTELTFMGRSLNNMNIDGTWNEHALKRRSKRDD